MTNTKSALTLIDWGPRNMQVKLVLGNLGKLLMPTHFTKLMTENCDPGEDGLDAGVCSSSVKTLLGSICLSGVLVSIPSETSNNYKSKC